MILPDLWQKCKGLLLSREFLTATLIVLVGTASFGLGRLSVYEEQKVPITIEYPEGERGEADIQQSSQGASKETKAAQAASAILSTPISGGYVASKNGTKYYLPWCGGVSRIKEENKVWFATKEEAEKAGFTPAANCKGI